MSGKNNKKRPGQRHNANRGLNIAIAIAAVVLVALIALLIVLEVSRKPNADPTSGTAGTTGSTGSASTGFETVDPGASQESTGASVQIENVESVSVSLSRGMEIVDVGSYTGMYMEDGSDEIVSGVLMIVVANKGEEDIQYAEITLSAGAETAYFSLTTLPAGESVVLLEQNRMSYSKSVIYSDAKASNVAVFKEPMSLREDLITIQALKGAMNITNISGADITGDIVIYYKNSSSDMLYGGITYRVRLSGGMKKDEIKQIVSDHFSAGGSSIMFVTCG